MQEHAAAPVVARRSATSSPPRPGLRGTVVDASVRRHRGPGDRGRRGHHLAARRGPDKVLDAGPRIRPTSSHPGSDGASRTPRWARPSPAPRPARPVPARPPSATRTDADRGAGGRHPARRERHVAPVARARRARVGPERGPPPVHAGRETVASTPGRIRPWRHLAAFAGIVVVLYALVFFTGDSAHAQARHRPAGRHPGHADRAHGVGRRAAAGAAPAGPDDHRAARERAGRERRRGRPRRHQHHDHGAGRGGRPGPVARADGAAAVPRGRRRPRGRGAPRCRPIPPRPGGPSTRATGHRPGHGRPAASPTPDSDAPADATLPPQGAAGAAVVTQDVAPVALAQPLAGCPADRGVAAPPAAPPRNAGSRRQRPRRTRRTPPLAAAIDEARPTPPEHGRTACRPRPCRRSTARRRTRCAATTTRRCRWSAATRTARRSTCSARASSRARRSPRAQAAQNTQGAGWVIDVTFKSDGAAIWGDYTSKNVGKNVAFVLDGEVVSAPTIQGPIFGTTQITGQFSQAEAQNLAGILRYGSLPLSFESSEAQTVSATLGLASLRGRADRRRCRARARVRLLPVLLPGARRAHDPVAGALRRGRLRRAGAARPVGRLHAGPRRRRRVHRRDRHHRRLVRDLLRAAQGRGPRGPQLPVGGAAGLGAGPADDPLRRRRELPGRGRALRARGRPGEGLRVHPRHVHRARPGRRVPGDPPAGGAGVEQPRVQQPGVVRAGCGGADRRARGPHRGREGKRHDGDARSHSGSLHGGKAASSPGSTPAPAPSTSSARRSPGTSCSALLVLVCVGRSSSAGSTSASTSPAAPRSSSRPQAPARRRRARTCGRSTSRRIGQRARRGADRRPAATARRC